MVTINTAYRVPPPFFLLPVYPIKLVEFALVLGRPRFPSPFRYPKTCGTKFKGVNK